jgi:Ca2+-binding EF-hand superfamily protein
MKGTATSKRARKMSITQQQEQQQQQTVKQIQLTYKLTDEQLCDYMEAFKFFDKDGNGSIEMKELQYVLKRLGVEPTTQEVKEMLDMIDTDRSGTIEFPEFLNMLCTAEQEAVDPQQEVEETFKVFDINGDGFISATEFKSVLTQIGGANVTDEQVEAMIAEVDLNGDEQIDIYEFKRLMSSLSLL